MPHRLTSMGLVRRDVPFGEPERSGKRSLYRIADPFFRLWFRVVAPHRALLLSGTPGARRRLLDRHWPALVSAAWEDLCRQELVHWRLDRAGVGWRPGVRWWHGAAPEWDVVSERDGRLLLGEAKWRERAVARGELGRMAAALAARPAPPLRGASEALRVLFVPELARGAPRQLSGITVSTARDLGLVARR